MKIPALRFALALFCRILHFRVTPNDSIVHLLRSNPVRTHVSLESAADGKQRAVRGRLRWSGAARYGGCVEDAFGFESRYAQRDSFLLLH